MNFITQHKFLRAVRHSLMHQQPLQIPDDSADDAANDSDTTSATVQTAEPVVACSDTSDCCEVCLLHKREDVALVPCCCIFDSVAVVQTLSHPWTVVVHAVHPFTWCCAGLVKCTLTRT